MLEHIIKTKERHVMKIVNFKCNYITNKYILLVIPQFSGGHGLTEPWPWNWLSFDSYGRAVSYTHLFKITLTDTVSTHFWGLKKFFWRFDMKISED